MEDKQEKGNFGWAVLGFFIPLVGLILFLVWKNDRHGDAKMAGMGALISVIVSIVLTAIIGVVFYTIVWPALHFELVQQTCNTYGEGYTAKNEGDDHWYCIAENGTKIDLSRELDEQK